jgi:hypothetical protein
MQTTGSVADNAKSLEKAKLLWEEYRYRHDLMWRLTFQITAAFVALSVAPYLNQGIVEGLGIWIVAVPGLQGLQSYV